METTHRQHTAHWSRFPATRYLGSKRKLLPVLEEVFGRLEFETALDPFCGTGAVAYLLKTMGKAVTASDILAANVVAARALIENDAETLQGRMSALLEGIPDPAGPPGFIERTFEGVFFEREENRFLDQCLPRVRSLSGFVRDLALWSVFQACLLKRPYNLFHRSNLEMRRREVTRSFGNKATWDRSFHDHLKKIAGEADGAVFPGLRRCRARLRDVVQIESEGDAVDLVYLDPPYVSKKGAGVDYCDYYHFLEGLCDPEGWPERILHRYKHKPIRGRGRSPWSDRRRIEAAFEDTIARFRRSKMVISYRSDGIPSPPNIIHYLKHVGKRVEMIDVGSYVYALSRNRVSREIIFIAV